jgi:hypothetical protein
MPVAVGNSNSVILDDKVGFEVLIAVVMKSTIFWDITPCSPLKASSACHLLSRWFLLGLFFDPEGESNVPPRHWLTFSRPQGVISQKTVPLWMIKV